MEASRGLDRCRPRERSRRHDATGMPNADAPDDAEGAEDVVGAWCGCMGASIGVSATS